MEGEKISFFQNNTGLLFRKSYENQEQLVVPKEIPTKILYIAHQSMVAGHSGVARMYETLRRSFYCATISIFVYHTVRNFVLFSKELVRNKLASLFMKSSRTTAPICFHRHTRYLVTNFKAECTRRGNHGSVW